MAAAGDEGWTPVAEGSRFSIERYRDFLRAKVPTAASEISKRFGVSLSQVANIKRGAQRREIRELNPTYFTDGAAYCEAAERQFAMPSLFDLDAEEQEEVPA